MGNWPWSGRSIVNFQQTAVHLPLQQVTGLLDKKNSDRREDKDRDWQYQPRQGSVCNGMSGCNVRHSSTGTIVVKNLNSWREGGKLRQFYLANKLLMEKAKKSYG